MLSPTGPSQQTTVGTDRVVFKEMNITFTADGPKKKSVSADIVNDEVALEDDELVSVVLDIVSPTSGVHFGSFQTTVVTIIDDDCKFYIVWQVWFFWSVS